MPQFLSCWSYKRGSPRVAILAHILFALCIALSFDIRQLINYKGVLWVQVEYHLAPLTLRILYMVTAYRDNLASYLHQIEQLPCQPRAYTDTSFHAFPIRPLYRSFSSDYYHRTNSSCNSYHWNYVDYILDILCVCVGARPAKLQRLSEVQGKDKWYELEFVQALKS